MRRTQRLFALAEYLRGRRTGVTATELAERFEVTERTIYRDLDALKSAALPLHAERGRGGGYALDRSYSLPPVNFTAREAAMLLLAGKLLSELRLLPFTDTLQTGLDKVRSALPVAAQRELVAQLSRLDFVGVPAKPVRAEVRRAVEQAWFEGSALRIKYLSAAMVETERRVRLRKVLLDRSETLLLVDDLDRGQERQLKLDRILFAEVLSASDATPTQTAR